MKRALRARRKFRFPAHMLLPKNPKLSSSTSSKAEGCVSLFTLSHEVKYAVSRLAYSSAEYEVGSVVVLLRRIRIAYCRM